MDTLSITSVYQLMAWLSERHIPYEIAGTSNMGLPLIVIRKPGKGRPVMITAGAHAMEPSGVSAALQILENWHYDFPLYMMPLRDPLGCQSYETILSHTLNRPVHFEGHDELSALLLKYADEVYIRNELFLLVRIGAVSYTHLTLPTILLV